MGERENQISQVEDQDAYLKNFLDEMKEVKNRDKTMHAIKDVEKLDLQCMNIWYQLKNLIDNGKKEDFSPDFIRKLGESTYSLSLKSEDSNVKEFYAWARNLMAVLGCLHDLNDEDFNEDMEMIKKKIYG